MDIERGKRLSVGPAQAPMKLFVSPVEEMHSLNFVNKVKECNRIDDENEKLVSKLTSVPSTVQNQSELIEHWEENKKFLKMISRTGKDGVDDVSKHRDLYLKKAFNKVSSKLELNATSGYNTERGAASQLKETSFNHQLDNSMDIALNSKDTANTSTLKEEDSKM